VRLIRSVKGCQGSPTALSYHLALTHSAHTTAHCTNQTKRSKGLSLKELLFDAEGRIRVARVARQMTEAEKQVMTMMRFGCVLL